MVFGMGRNEWDLDFRVCGDGEKMKIRVCIGRDVMWLWRVEVHDVDGWMLK
ncbi:hypothetical protein Hanom_Chr02g00146651 [Helianthus anomalus]